MSQASAEAKAKAGKVNLSLSPKSITDIMDTCNQVVTSHT